MFNVKEFTECYYSKYYLKKFIIILISKSKHFKINIHCLFFNQTIFQIKYNLRQREKYLD